MVMKTPCTEAILKSTITVLFYYGCLPLCGMASLAIPFPLLPVAGKDSAKINAGNAMRMLKG